MFRVVCSVHNTVWTTSVMYGVVYSVHNTVWTTTERPSVGTSQKGLF